MSPLLPPRPPRSTSPRPCRGWSCAAPPGRRPPSPRRRWRRTSRRRRRPPGRPPGSPGPTRWSPRSAPPRSWRGSRRRPARGGAPSAAPRRSSQRHLTGDDAAPGATLHRGKRLGGGQRLLEAGAERLRLRLGRPSPAIQMRRTRRVMTAWRRRSGGSYPGRLVGVMASFQASPLMKPQRVDSPTRSLLRGRVQMPGRSRGTSPANPSGGATTSC